MVPSTSRIKVQQRSKHYLIFAVHSSRALLWVDSSTQKRCLPRVHVVLGFAGQLQGFPVSAHVPSLWIVDGEHVPTGHEPGLQISQLQVVQRQHVLLVSLLLVLEPRQRLRGQNEPVVAASSLHDAHIVDRHVPLADDLVAQFPAGFLGVLASLIRRTRKQASIFSIQLGSAHNQAYLANPIKSSWFVFMYASSQSMITMIWSLHLCSFSRIYVVIIRSVSSLSRGYRFICNTEENRVQITRSSQPTRLALGTGNLTNEEV